MNEWNEDTLVRRRLLFKGVGVRLKGGWLQTVVCPQQQHILHLNSPQIMTELWGWRDLGPANAAAR